MHLDVSMLWVRSFMVGPRVYGGFTNTHTEGEDKIARIVVKISYMSQTE